MRRARGTLTEYKRNLEKAYQRIEVAMVLKRIRQYHIADELGINKSTVSQHFKKRTFSFEQILQIFEFLGLEFTVCEK